ncbi:MAG: TIGR01777 family oxidoreductase [Bacteroidota bacterium]|nr:TIGR01777 family oxidoreductase [Bacteroidota bacterium]
MAITKILICGGTGLIGSNLVQKLKQKNFEVVLLSTQQSKCNNQDVFYWNPDQDKIDEKALIDVDVIVNLSGQGIFDKPFTEKRKQELIDSRVKPLAILLKTIQKNKLQLPQLISASAIGYYPNICSNKLDENSTKEDAFISNLVNEWEKSALEFEKINTKVCVFRFGIVLSNKGGFIKKLAQPIKFFIGAIPGNGKQIISWIHIDDLTNMIVWAIDKQLNGTYNAVTPNPTDITRITKLLASQMNRNILLPNIPEFMISLIFGKERGQLLLSSQIVSSNKIQSTGFNFNYSNIEKAIENI